MHGLRACDTRLASAVFSSSSSSRSPDATGEIRAIPRVKAAEAKRQPARGQPHSGGAVLTEMKGVDFRIDPSVVLEVHYLRGALEPTHEDKSVWFDDPSSFRLRIDDAEIAVTAASMSAMMNHYAFAGPKAPLKDVEVEI